ncbi:MAG: glycosyltransferase, partial [Rhizobiales bacterium]|nr:glycosyltransferase [Hyphomicrobiales bacterium]
AWERLNREGLPEKAGVKLVFVGRHGWDVDPVLKGIAEARNLIHLADADDSLLSLLYEKAAFCVYPSLYEGYGLPIVEAFRHGRAVIASDRGSIPEVMADLGPCLDPGDEDAWAAALRDWIIHPAAIAEREAAIRAGFRPVTWDEAAARYIGQALSVFDLPPR